MKKKLKKYIPVCLFILFSFILFPLLLECAVPIPVLKWRNGGYSSLEFNKAYYTSPATLDVNNDGVTDFNLSGNLVDKQGVIDEFDSGSNFDMSSNTTGTESFLFNITVPRNLEFSQFTLYLSSISDTILVSVCQTFCNLFCLIALLNFVGFSYS